ncbi:bifunctional RNase H/acid phosphatase [Prauserella cavernicola]|uniref:Bifunctional RNase H/acid phosphatase n=1 Tax=Prauserella cavernicola TaxID=2800127 RepID=A0A934R1A3_9PSEU|nr:bifunctional RNase H/acid phosphatase [Prauserella cavernicola]MBK1788993.1 bifunctional RNase H/acid phosphatase [Prauserella cavernicola]
MTEHVVVEADGGSRGNPGPAGYGAVVKDAGSGDVLAERKKGLGVATNNVAEYSGLIAGLEAARDVGASTVDVRMDSKLVVEQMSGRWKIKNAALQPLADQARELAGAFARVRYEWIPRALNSHADRLANEAMDAQAGGSGKEPSAAPKQDRVSPTGWTGATGTPTRLLLLRHGQTEMSVDRRYSGRGDIGLTEHGRWQASSAAKRLAGMEGFGDEPPVVVASPLTRTMQTAQAVADAVGTRVSTLPGLVETDFGEWEGLTFAEASRRDPDVHASWMSDTSVPPPGGESFDQVHKRVRAAADELFETHPGRTVIVVSHVTPIKSLLRVALEAGPSLLFRLHLDPASLSIADFYPDGNASVRLVNDISHLR